MANKDERTYIKLGAEWGWIHCREVMRRAAISFFMMENDEAAGLLRNLVNHDLVIEADTFEGAPQEHCAPGCNCRVSEETDD